MFNGFVVARAVKGMAAEGTLPLTRDNQYAAQSLGAAMADEAEQAGARFLPAMPVQIEPSFGLNLAAGEALTGAAVETVARGEDLRAGPAFSLRIGNELPWLVSNSQRLAREA